MGSSASHGGRASAGYRVWIASCRGGIMSISPAVTGFSGIRSKFGGVGGEPAVWGGFGVAGWAPRSRSVTQLCVAWPPWNVMCIMRRNGNARAHAHVCIHEWWRVHSRPDSTHVYGWWRVHSRPDSTHVYGVWPPLRARRVRVWALPLHFRCPRVFAHCPCPFPGRGARQSLCLS
jgi:hypothetical protein